MRTVSVAWLNRIAAALDVEPADLVTLSERPEIPVAAILGPRGVESPRRAMLLTPPHGQPHLLGMVVEASLGDYRAGDQLWLERLDGAAMARGINRDCLAPLADRTLCFGRLLGMEAGGTLTLLPISTSERAMTGLTPAWIAVPVLLIRPLDNHSA